MTAHSKSNLIQEAESLEQRGRLYVQQADATKNLGQRAHLQKEAGKLSAQAAKLRAKANRYPYAPGHRGGDTSKAAANKMKPVFTKRQETVFQQLVLGDATNTEIFAALAGLTEPELKRYYALRKLERGLQPRAGELSKMGRVFDTGCRRANADGNQEIVWSTEPPEQRNQRKSA